MKRVAVLGAGLTGTVAALCLADGGAQVNLYERNTTPLAAASGMNEGKIHLGYVYAMDRSLRTAQTMIGGAACFRRILERWVDPAVFERHVSSAFTYAVPHSSMLSLDAIRTHFSNVHEMSQRFDTKAMADHGAGMREHSKAELESVFDPRLVAASFQTNEIAVDPLALRDALVTALAAAPNITARYSTEVSSIVENPGGYSVLGRDADGPVLERYDAVVNATWHQRLKLDATIGMHSSRQAIHRYKCGLRMRDPIGGQKLPSVTFIVGEYGDTVAYGEQAFVSWYPVGLISQEIGESPKVDDVMMSPARQGEIVKSTLENLQNLMPGVSGLLTPDAAKWDVVGGYIFAWGETGIDHADSELHDRYDIGIHSKGHYHSVDTGKYSLAPLFAKEVAERILI